MIGDDLTHRITRDIDRMGFNRQVRRRVAMLLHNQPRFLAKLQGDVVPRDKEVLPADTGPPGRMQKRSALHVSGRDLSQLLPRPQSFCQVRFVSCYKKHFANLKTARYRLILKKCRLVCTHKNFTKFSIVPKINRSSLNIGWFLFLSECDKKSQNLI